MPKRKEQFVMEGYYHIFNRGNQRQALFHSQVDYSRFVSLIMYYRYKWPWSYSEYQRLVVQDALIGLKSNPEKLVDIVAYCILPNHFHLLLRQRADNGVRIFLSRVQLAYARYYSVRRRSARVKGYLFEGSFKSILVRSSVELLHLSRYIHLNPYSHDIVSSIDELLAYKWSSLPLYTGQYAADWIENGVVLTELTALDSYIDFVLANAEYQRQFKRSS